MPMIESNTVTLPAELLDRMSGLGIDFGGSVIKAAYLSKADFEQQTPTERGASGGDVVRVHLVSFPREDVTEALSYLREKIHVRAPPVEGSGRPRVVGTGAGAEEFRQQIEDMLAVRLDLQWETRCSLRGFHNLLPCDGPGQELFFEESLEAVNRGKTIGKQLCELLKKLNLTSGKTDDTVGTDSGLAAEQEAGGDGGTAGHISTLPPPGDESDDDLYPYMFGTAGSGWSFVKVDKDLSLRTVGYSSRGGRTFMGLGSLLCDTKTFDELIDLASRGDHRNVDIFPNDLMKIGRGDDMYSAFTVDAPSFSYGKLAGQSRETFRREDLARAVLQHVCMDAVKTIATLSLLTGARYAFLMGGFLNHPFIREVLLTEFYTFKEEVPFLLGKKLDTKLRMVKIGSHLGAVGALLVNSEHGEFEIMDI